MESVLHAPAQGGRRLVSTPRSMNAKKGGRRRRSGSNSGSSCMRPLLSSDSQSTSRQMMTATLVSPESGGQHAVPDRTGTSSPSTFPTIRRAVTPTEEQQRAKRYSPTPQGIRQPNKPASAFTNRQRRSANSRDWSPPISAPASPSSSRGSSPHQMTLHPQVTSKLRGKDGDTTITTTTASTASALDSRITDQDLLPTAALDCSSKAAACLQNEDFEGALHWYQRALVVYQKQKAARAQSPQSSAYSCADIVDTCNAAATLHNMGAVCKVLQIGTHALRCCEEAENLYRICQTRINQLPASHTQVLSEDLLQSQECVCLDLQVAETLQHRAAMYESVARDDVACIECHEACVDLLRAALVQGEASISAAAASWNIDEDDSKDPMLCPVIVADDVYFRLHVPAEARLDAIAMSYQTLARLYRNTDSPQDGLEALKDLRTLLEARLELQLKRGESTAQVRTLLATCWKHQSEYHFAQKEFVDAVNALHRAMDTQLEAAPETKDNNSQSQLLLDQNRIGENAREVSTELLEQMNNIGGTQEQQGDYDKALASYEKVLLVRSQFLGEDHLDVAETLVKIGRVMEAQGNVGDGLDLYHAAHAIYQAAVKRAEEDDQESTTHAATESVVRIANVLMGQKRWQEAVDFLLDLPQIRPVEEMLEAGQAKADEVKNQINAAASALPSVDQAIVFRELGRAYMGMGCLTKAKNCLLKSACQLEGTEHEEDVFELLTHVEFLQKERINSPDRRHQRGKNGGRRQFKSSHSRTHSASSNGTVTSDDNEKSKITTEVVAAVLSKKPDVSTLDSNPSAHLYTSNPANATKTDHLTVDESLLKLQSQGKEQPQEPTCNDDGDPPLISTYISTSASTSSGSCDQKPGDLMNVRKNEAAEYLLKTADAIDQPKLMLLEKVDHDDNQNSANTLDDDERKADVQSAVLLGEDIDFDPPRASSSAVERPGECSGSKRISDVLEQGHSDRPFDEPSSSNSSTAQEDKAKIAFDHNAPYPLVVHQRLLQMSQQTDIQVIGSKQGQGNGNHKTKLGNHPAENTKKQQDEESKVSSLDLLSLALTSSVSFPVASVASGESMATPSATYTSKATTSLLDIHQHGDHEPSDRDDYSSDPFEGYDHYGNEVSDGEGSTEDSANSESEEGYETFRKGLSASDCSSAEKSTHMHDSDTPKGSSPSRFKGNHFNPRIDDDNLVMVSRKSRDPSDRFDDYRQPHQNPDIQHSEALSSAGRESPVSSSNSFIEELDSLNQKMRRELAASARDISPSFRVTVDNRFPEADSLSSSDISDNHKKPEELSAGKESTLERAEQSTPTRIKQNSTSRANATRDSPGNRIVKALSNSLRRRRNQNNGFNVLDSPKQVAGQTSVTIPYARDSQARLQLPERNLVDGFDENDSEMTGTGALPIPFIALSPSHEDTVSQITFINDDWVTSKIGANRNSQWWGQLGLSTERLEGWFPANSYLNQAVEAAEGFLSAKSIHAQVKSQPLDVSSAVEEDGDMEEDAVITPPSPSSPPAAPHTVQAIPTSPGANSLLLSIDTKVSPVILTTSKDEKQNQEATLNILDSPTRSPRSGSLQHDDSSGTKEILLEISECQKLLNTYEERDQSTDKPASSDVANTLFRLSVLQIKTNDLEAALKSTLESVRIHKVIGNAIETSRSLHLLADIHVRQEQYEAALSRYSEIEKLELQIYGYIHEETATTLNRIGSVHARWGQFGLAMEKHQEALRILKECHGEELRHPLVSQTLIHIGAVYYRERNSVEGATKSCEGYSTFIEAGMLEVIGRAHEDRGSYKMAISFFEEKLQYLNKLRGDPKSPDDVAELEDIAATLNSLGMLCCRAGIFMEAIDYYDNALEIQKKIGCDKMHVATARVLTATVQFHLGYFKKALRLLQDALEELQIETGGDHETVAATWFQIGVVHVALCNYDDAMDALEEALRIQNKVLGNLHPATLRTRREIGNMFAIYESELPAAFEQFYDILETQKRIHGPKHPNVAETLHSLGCAFARKGDYTTAIRTLEECYYMRIEFLGADHPLQATTLYEIAQIHMKRERFKKAIHICHTVLGIRKESLSEQHIDVAKALATKGKCLVAAGDHTEGKKCLAEALSMAEQAVGARHPTVADMFVQVGAICLRKCHFDEARESINKALDIFHNSSLDEDHPLFVEARKLMERVERDEMLCV